MRFSLALVALVHRVEGGPAIAARSPGPETHCVYERIASRRQANRITEAESHEGAHGNRITESQILRFGSTKGLKSQILESHVRFKQSQRNRRNRHKNDDLCDSMHKNEHSRRCSAGAGSAPWAACKCRGAQVARHAGRTGAQRAWEVCVRVVCAGCACRVRLRSRRAVETLYAHWGDSSAAQPLSCGEGSGHAARRSHRCA